MGQRNDLPPRSGRSVADIVRDNVFTRINAILTVLLVCVLATGSWINGAFGILIFFNSIIGIVQEVRAKRTLDSLAVVGEGTLRVLRDGEIVALGRDQIVLDDVIELAPGDQIMVDGEIVAESYLEIDESLLTGESDPVAKELGDDVLSGSFVAAGSGRYRATRVGQDAYAARLTAEANKFTLVRSELQAGINKILRLITFLLVPVGLLTVWVQLSHSSNDWRKAMLRMAGAIVPMVPEGLVLLTSVAFALGVIRLGRKQCLVQELPAIEGLARVDVVCADKTGTLTEKGMVFDALLPVNGFNARLARLILQNVAATDPYPNASMQAIVEHVGRPSRPWPSTAKAAFTSAKKWSGTSFAGQGHWVVGAPDVLADGPVAAMAEELGLQGLRVLLLGAASVPVDDPNAPGTVRPIALIVLKQRIRPDARATLDYFAEQQVAIKVISGDNAAAVGAVTAGLGLPGAVPVDARDLPEDEGAFADAVEMGVVFGRVTPQQKRRMVGALQRRGYTVAMTGDGVNDVLALKDADLGVAMGSGASATRAVAKIVLLNDAFATLPDVVAEGRRVIGNIERVANLFLTKTVYSALLALLVVVFQLPFPFQPIHVTITGWFTIGIPAFAMSLSANHAKAKPGFVGRVMQLGIPSGLIVALTTFVTYWLVHSPDDTSNATQQQATTATLAAMILVATWVLAIVARPYQWWKIGLIGMSLVAYTIIFCLPLTQQLFFLDVSNQSMMATALFTGIIGVLLVETVWWVSRIAAGVPRRWWDGNGRQRGSQVPVNS